jgi:hypothetical protein
MMIPAELAKAVAYNPLANIYAGLSTAEIRAINEMAWPSREIRELLALAGPERIAHACGFRPETEADRYDDALDVQKARREFRIVRPDEPEGN